MNIMKIRINGKNYWLWCPACKETHLINDTWSFDGNLENPTIIPSILVTNGHYVPGFIPGSECWCTYKNGSSSFKCIRCHSFVKNGQWEFLPDSTHRLAGQTVPMVDLPDLSVGE